MIDRFDGRCRVNSGVQANAHPHPVITHPSKQSRHFHLSGRGVDLNILRLLSLPLIGGETPVQNLFLERNQIGSEGATCRSMNLSTVVILMRTIDE